ncbi:uncharacterized protein LOC101891722 [Musca domestica]|uniref:Uncharacterized protein LOC101891722 n=1 Tax=Musca domestica TaxID=7370 RepID=A0A1I8MYX7_MUSDO|nr:uncharacterized protein LOC101891722 [Musca domestica]
MRRAQKLKIQVIQKEQMQLVKIEKTLEELLGNINESINTLKVEELQLKSNLVELYTSSRENGNPTTSSQALATTKIDTPSAIFSTLPIDSMSEQVAIDDGINKQLLDLESLLVPMKRKAVADSEEEEEEEDDTDTEEDMEDEEFVME